MSGGNLTLLGRLLPTETQALPLRVGKLLQDMLRVTAPRLAEGAGGVLRVGVAGQPRAHLARCNESKRARLSKVLSKRLNDVGRAASIGRSFLVQTQAGYGALEARDALAVFDAARGGVRRVLRPGTREAAPALRAVEVALSAAGSLDALNFRGARIAREELGAFFARVLEADPQASALAAAFELHATKGMWFESVRLAHLQLVAPAPADSQATKFADYACASSAELRELARLAEQIWVDGEATPEDFSDRARLSRRIAEAWAEGPLKTLDQELRSALAQRMLEHFLDFDMQRAARELEPMLEGRFACVVSSTLEPDSVVVLTRGRPLSIAVQSSTGCVAIASDRNALRVRDAQGRPVFDARLDLDLAEAELARVCTGDVLQPQLTLFSVADQRTYDRDELERAGRLVWLRDNPLTPPLPLQRKLRARQDLADLPALLRAIRDDYAAPGSRNRRSAETLAYSLLSHRIPRLLVVGSGDELALAEQFVANLAHCLRGVRAQAVGSARFLNESAIELLEADTVVLAISQSGHDDATLAVLQQIRRRFGESGHGRLFVLSGEADTPMAQLLGQSFAKRAMWFGRVLTNCGGYRPSAVGMASVNATHAALCELLFAICEAAQDYPQPQHGFVLSPRQVQSLRDRRDASYDVQVERILASGDQDDTSPLAVRTRALTGRFSRHVLEGGAGVLLALLVLQANLAWRMPLRPSALTQLLPAETRASWGGLATHVGAQLDVLFYLALVPLAVWMVRLVQRRSLLHRQGARELWIGDTGYVRRLVESGSRKLFALGYGFAAPRTRSLDPEDVGAHEAARGSLALVGIPDGRRGQLRGQFAAAREITEQFARRRSLAGAEVITVGHGDQASGAFGHLRLPDASIADSSREVDLLIEGLFDSWERMLAMQNFLCQLADTVAGAARYERTHSDEQVFAPTTMSPASGTTLLGVGRIVRGALSKASLPFEIISRSRSRSNTGPRRTADRTRSVPATAAKVELDEELGRDSQVRALSREHEEDPDAG